MIFSSAKHGAKPRASSVPILYDDKTCICIYIYICRNPSWEFKTELFATSCKQEFSYYEIPPEEPFLIVN